MCQGIMNLSNALIYGDRLRCGSSEIASAKLEFSGLHCGLPWLEDVRLFSSKFSLSYLWGFSFIAKFELFRGASFHC